MSTGHAPFLLWKELQPSQIAGSNLRKKKDSGKKENIPRLASWERRKGLLLEAMALSLSPAALWGIAEQKAEVLYRKMMLTPVMWHLLPAWHLLSALNGKVQPSFQH